MVRDKDSHCTIISNVTDKYPDGGVLSDSKSVGQTPVKLSYQCFSVSSIDSPPYNARDYH